jgi:hypothetical protein
LAEAAGAAGAAGAGEAAGAAGGGGSGSSVASGGAHISPPAGATAVGVAGGGGGSLPHAFNATNPPTHTSREIHRPFGTLRIMSSDRPAEFEPGTAASCVALGHLDNIIFFIFEGPQMSATRPRSNPKPPAILSCSCP